MEDNNPKDEETTYMWEIDEENIDNYEEFYNEIRNDPADINNNENNKDQNT